MLPRKGTRRIVVAGQLFRWRARHEISSNGSDSWDVATVVIEAEGGGVCTIQFDAREIGITGWRLKYAQILPITPRLIRALIEELPWDSQHRTLPPSECAYEILRAHPDTGRTGVRAGTQPARYQR